MALGLSGMATCTAGNEDGVSNTILWLNWTERWSTKPEIGGSNPSRIAKFIAEWSSLAARLAHNQEVDGANPSSASNTTVHREAWPFLPASDAGDRWFESNWTDLINICMFYTVYKITNNLNKKIYIGVHKTNNLHDNYMGSSSILRNSIRKYGRHNFIKEIIAIFDNPDSMFTMEAEIVNEEFVARKDTYNSKVGGYGIGHFNASNARSYVEKSKEAVKAILSTDPNWKKRISEKVSQTMKGRSNPHWSGKQHTVETKAKMSRSHRGKHVGDKNSQYGTIWITNGIESKKIPASQDVPIGWRKGRIINRV